MAYTTIDDPSAHFQITTWTGNTSAPRSITNDGNSDLKPDIVWAKNRTTNGTDHELYNSTMGTGTDENLQPNNANGKGTATTYGQLTSFDTDGFTVNAGGTNDDKFNENGSEFVAWLWKVGGGSTSTNNDGSIAATVQANTTAGVSLVFYTGNGTQTGQTVGHGLGAVPKMIISKDRDATSNVATWRVYHQAVGNTKYVSLDSNAAAGTFNDWDNTTPTSSVYSVGGSGGYTPTNTNNTEYIALVFTDVKGFSKFGQYEGNGQRDGVFVYLGFQPAFVMIKNIDSSGRWTMFDNKRTIANGDFEYLVADDNHAESDTGLGYTDPIDFLSNGFKQKNSDAFTNAASTYLYMAFAENPFVTSTGVPATAR